jgi:hypothetical protein
MYAENIVYGPALKSIIERDNSNSYIFADFLNICKIILMSHLKLKVAAASIILIASPGKPL